MPCIRFNPSASVRATEAGVVFRSSLGTMRLSGERVRRLVTRLMPLLDGSRDREAIFEALPDCSPGSVGALLDLLVDREVLDLVPDLPTLAR